MAVPRHFMLRELPLMRFWHISFENRRPSSASLALGRSVMLGTDATGPRCWLPVLPTALPRDVYPQNPATRPQGSPAWATGRHPAEGTWGVQPTPAAAAGHVGKWSFASFPAPGCTVLQGVSRNREPGAETNCDVCPLARFPPRSGRESMRTVVSVKPLSFNVIFLCGNRSVGFSLGPVRRKTPHSNLAGKVVWLCVYLLLQVLSRYGLPITLCKFKMGSVMIRYRNRLQNDDHGNLSQHLSPHIVTFFPLWWRLLRLLSQQFSNTYFSIAHSGWCVLHYIPRACFSYNEQGKF